MRTLLLCLAPAALVAAFVTAFIRIFKPTRDTEGEQ